jgi:hypothetical protein
MQHLGRIWFQHVGAYRDPRMISHIYDDPGRILLVDALNKLIKLFPIWIPPEKNLAATSRASGTGWGPDWDPEHAKRPRSGCQPLDSQKGLRATLN